MNKCRTGMRFKRRLDRRSKRALDGLILALLAVGLCGAAAANDGRALQAPVGPALQAPVGRVRIGLRDKAVVAGEVVRLGDVAELGKGAPERLAALSLGNAPWAGRFRNVGRILLKARLASAGFALAGFEFTGVEVCVVERATVRIEPREIVEAARKHILARFPAGGPELSIELVRKPSPVLLPALAEPPVLRPAVQGRGVLRGLVRVDVDILGGQTRLKRVAVHLNVRQFARVAVARRRIASGDRLTERNVSLERREITGVRGTCVSAMNELEGKVAERSIAPAQVITRERLRPAEEPIVVQRNQRVFLIVETAALRAVTLGKALSRARRGEIARAKNLRSGREVVGIAVRQGTIRVMTGEELDER